VLDIRGATMDSKYYMILDKIAGFWAGKIGAENYNPDLKFELISELYVVYENFLIN